MPDHGTRLLAGFTSLEELIGACFALDAGSCGGLLSRPESDLVAAAAPFRGDLAALRRGIANGSDPLGEAYRGLRSRTELRRAGAFYTPPEVVSAMVDWVLARQPARVVDAGCGSGRFAAEVVRRAPAVEVVAVDLDPVATLTCRAALSVTGAARVRVVQGDYITVDLGEIDGRTAFVGNPPYVRHHDLAPEVKAWARLAAARHDLPTPSLAGLHVHFVLATLDHARRGDVCAFVTSAQWLDVKYGATLRKALSSRCSGVSLHLLDPKTAPFGDAMTTAVVACFVFGGEPTAARLRRVAVGAPLGPLDRGGRLVPRAELDEVEKWGPLFAGPPTVRPEELAGGKRLEGRGSRHITLRDASLRAAPQGERGDTSTSTSTTTTTTTLRDFVPLGQIVRVSRGVATGCNGFFVLSAERAAELGLGPWVRPALTRAREVFDSVGEVRGSAKRKVLLCPARDVDLSTAPALRAYLQRGAEAGVPTRYLCAHRAPWWHLRCAVAPAVATYMARQPPAFALNPEGLVCLNVVHGFYPRQDLPAAALAGLTAFLNANREGLGCCGRTYQGGLVKLEPREMEAILVPRPERLAEFARELTVSR